MTNKKFVIGRNTKRRFVVRVLSINEKGIPSITDLKSFKTEAEAKAYKKKVEQNE